MSGFAESTSRAPPTSGRGCTRAPRDQAIVSLLTGLQEFVRDHHPRDGMTADATEPEENGYRLTVTCAWGAEEQRVTDPTHRSHGDNADHGLPLVCRLRLSYSRGSRWAFAPGSFNRWRMSPMLVMVTAKYP